MQKIKGLLMLVAFIAIVIEVLPAKQKKTAV
jgi:hypothetical protein